MAAVPKNIGPTGEHIASATTTVVVPFMRTQYNYDSGVESDRVANLITMGPSLTVQSHKDQTDLNIMLDRMGINSLLQSDLARPVFYADFEDIQDFRSAFDAVRQAQESFDALDARVRDRFGNDPQRFLEFCETPGNDEEMRKLGLTIEKVGATVSPAVDVPPQESKK